MNTKRKEKPVKTYLQIAVCLLAVAMAAQHGTAQDTGVPDTLYYGDDGKAYCYPGSIFRVPVYITTDQELMAVQIGMEYGSGSMCPTWDSISECGGIMMDGNYLDLGIFLDSSSINGVCPDTLGYAGIAMFNLLPMGKYKFYDFWFTGGGIGQQVVVDSSMIASASPWLVLFVGDGGSPYPPQFVGGLLDIVAPPVEFTLLVPTDIEVEAGSTVVFDVETVPHCIPVLIALDSIVNNITRASLPTLPPTFGTNPLTVEWTTSFAVYGLWTAHFTATEGNQNSLEFTAEITIYQTGDPCAEVRGDPNCDGIVDIDDAVYIINYIFAQGPPPGCE